MGHQDQNAQLDIALPLMRLRLRFAALQAGTTEARPAFPGNLWRGAMGHALKRLSCVQGVGAHGGKACSQSCQHLQGCAYGALFETPPPPDADRMRRYTQVPHPYVLRELPGRQAGEVLLLLTLVGSARAHAALAVEALRQAAAGPHGIGGDQFVLLDVGQERMAGTSPSGPAELWPSIADARGVLRPLPLAPYAAPALRSGAVHIELLTPLRVKREGKALRASAIGFADVFGTLMRRVSMLCAFHGERPLEAPFAELKAHSHQVTAEMALVPLRQQRFSNRQHQAIPMDGVMGTITLNEADARPIWPFLWWGQWLHMASAATMGLGCYQLASPQACQPPLASPSTPTSAP